MRILGMISVAGILFFLLCAQIVPSGYSDVTPTREHGRRTIRQRKKMKPLSMLCSQKTGLTKDIMTNKLRENGGGLETLFKEVCSKDKELRACVMEFLNSVHNCGPEQSSLMSILVDKVVTYVCENNSSLLYGFFPPEGLTCFANDAEGLPQCTKPPSSAFSVENNPQGKKCNKSGTEAELHICRSFRGVYECLFNAIKFCEASPRETLDKVYNLVVNDSYCEKYKMDEKKIAGKICGKTPCHLNYTFSGIGPSSTSETESSFAAEMGSSSTSEIGSSSTSRIVTSYPVSKVTTQPTKHESTEEKLTKPVFPVSSPVSTDADTTTRIGAHPDTSQIDKKFGNDSRTVNCKANSLDLSVFSVILPPSLMIILYIK